MGERVANGSFAARVFGRKMQRVYQVVEPMRLVEAEESLIEQAGADVTQSRQRSLVAVDGTSGCRNLAVGLTRSLVAGEVVC